jgi:hypothetical protein
MNHACGVRQSGGSRMSRLERILVLFGVLLPVPVLAATGLAIPLPATVERLAARLVPLAEAATIEADEVAVRARRGTIIRTPAEKAAARSAPRGAGFGERTTAAGPSGTRSAPRLAGPGRKRAARPSLPASLAGGARAQKPDATPDAAGAPIAAESSSGEQPAPAPAPHPQPVHQPSPAPKPEPQPTPEPRPQPQPAPEPRPAPQPEPQPEPEPEPQPEPAPQPAPKPVKPTQPPPPPRPPLPINLPLPIEVPGLTK